MNSTAQTSNPQGAFNVSVPFAELHNPDEVVGKWFGILHPVVAKAYTWAHDWYKQYNRKDFYFTHSAAFGRSQRLWTDELFNHVAITDRRYTTRDFAAMTYYITRDNNSRRPMRFKIWVCPNDASAPHHHKVMRYDVIVDFFHPNLIQKRYTLFWKGLDWHTLTTANLLACRANIKYRKHLEAQADMDAKAHGHVNVDKLNEQCGVCGGLVKGAANVAQACKCERDANGKRKQDVGHKPLTAHGKQEQDANRIPTTPGFTENNPPRTWADWERYFQMLPEDDRVNIINALNTLRQYPAFKGAWDSHGLFGLASIAERAVKS